MICVFLSNLYHQQLSLNLLLPDHWEGEIFWAHEMLMLNVSGVTNLCKEPASRASFVIMPNINFS